LFKKRDPLRKSFEILRDVRILRDRITRIQSRLDDRAAELSKRLVDLQSRGETYLATRYAEEIANLKRLSSGLSLVLVVLDKIDLAIQHAIIRREFATLASELSTLLRDLSKLPETRIPELSVVYADLETGVRELMELSSSEALSITYNPPTGSEVRAILEEAKTALRERLEPAR
jgi:division protein CdvB (Snf7/Vps24/ESCRT-III family)